MSRLGRSIPSLNKKERLSQSPTVGKGIIRKRIPGWKEQTASEKR